MTLTCSTDANPTANYTWYKENGNFISLNKGPQLVFSSIQSSDSAEYFCTAENELGRISKNVFINVKYAPKLPSVSVSPSAEIEEGSSVTLTCSSDANPAAKYTWYKKNEDSPKASGQIYNITDFRAEHSGSYYCGAQNKLGRSNSTLHLSVVAANHQPRSHIGITLGFLLFIIIILSAYLRTIYSLTNQWRKLRQRLNSIAQTLRPLTCPQFVHTVFSALTNHLTRIIRTRWSAECSKI
ncbi:B-cell receptor CD22-like isoform X2 [Trematomus bernacchii]|uniref:B-cell receptor CD22-like isoform X2 n=1 Tax=Trematomus bernacchii TaxID=40690 RepID=UPI00146AB00F|nr:B-cell receptor CD22-like isoform X2 [Trematomus bernacchii]